MRRFRSNVLTRQARRPLRKSEIDPATAKERKDLQTNLCAGRTAANGVHRRSVNRDVEVNRGGPRIEDAVAAAQRPVAPNQAASRQNRRAGRSCLDRRCEDALADIRHVRQIVLRNHVSGLHKSADGRADGVAARVHLHPRLIKRRIESRDGAARFVRRKIQLVTQTEIERQLLRNLPVILNEETVVSRAQEAVLMPSAYSELLARPSRKLLKVWKVIWPRRLLFVVN